MAIEGEATYENGVLKLAQPLKTSQGQEFYGRLKWMGDPDVLRKIAEDDEELYASEYP